MSDKVRIEFLKCFGLVADEIVPKYAGRKVTRELISEQLGEVSYGVYKHQQSLIDELQPWKEAVIDHMMVTHCSIGESPKEKLDNILNWYIAIECDPQVSDSTAAQIIDAKDAEIVELKRKIDTLEDFFIEH